MGRNWILLLDNRGFEFVPCLAGGDGFRGGGGEVFGIRGDADAAKVEAGGVEADSEGGFSLGRTAVVDLAGGNELPERLFVGEEHGDQGSEEDW